MRPVSENVTGASLLRVLSSARGSLSTNVGAGGTAECELGLDIGGFEVVICGVQEDFTSVGIGRVEFETDFPGIDRV